MVRAALEQGGLIDITTTGRRSGEPRRIEIGFHNVGGRLVIAGRPVPGQTTAWFRNLEADPRLTVHLKHGVVADLPATARIVTGDAERRELAGYVASAWNNSERVIQVWGRTDIDAMVAWSPLVEVTIPGYEPPAQRQV